MKKFFSIFATLCVALGVSAQQTTIPSDYWAKYEADYETYDSWWDVDDQTKNVKALKGLTPNNGMKIDPSSISNNAYTITALGDDVFKVEYVKTTDYEKFGFSWMEWAYSECANDNWQLVNPITGEAWGEGENCHRTAKGYSVDFSDPGNRIVSFKYQAISNVSVSLRVDLWDIKGRKTTKTGQVFADNVEKVNTYEPSVEKQWKECTMAFVDFFEHEEVEEELETKIETDFVNSLTSTPLADGHNTWFNGIQFSSEPPESLSLLLDTSRIIGVEMYINCDKKEAGDLVELYIKDLCVGNTITRDDIEEYQGPQAVEVVEGNSVEIVEGVVYSEGRIEVLDILGKVVKTAKEELSIKDLPTGIYFIKTAEGTARFVK